MKTILIFFGIFVVGGLLIMILVFTGFLKISEWRFIRKFRKRRFKMSESKPIPIPEGMTDEQINAMTVNDGEWRKSPDFICCRCDGPAYLNPYTNYIWGCKKCGFTTYSVGLYFRPVN